MKNKVKKFQLEELEQRFEMGWSAKKIDYKIDTPNGSFKGEFEL